MIKRYFPKGSTYGFREHRDGNWVTYEDHYNEIRTLSNELNKRIEELENKLQAEYEYQAGASL